jgi:DNA-directed RNA polymerase specialized sigma subunit
MTHRSPTGPSVRDALEIEVSEWQEVKVSSETVLQVSLDEDGRCDNHGLSHWGDMLISSISFQLAQEDQIRFSKHFNKSKT